MSPDKQEVVPAAGSDDVVEMVENAVPLDGIEKEAVELIELYGGTVESTKGRWIGFTLPNRRGIVASGRVRCELSWTDEAGEGEVRLISSDASEGPSMQHIGLLVAGAAGSIVFILWPFFPSLTPAAGIGAVLAIGAYLLTLRRKSVSVAAYLLKSLVDAQKEKASSEPE